MKSVPESISDPLRYWDVNVNGTINLLNVMKKYNCKSIIFSSSATVYGNVKETFLREDLPCNPCNPYGETKVVIEKILSNIFTSDPDNWRICNLRYFNPVGADPSGLFGEKFSYNPSNLFPYLNLVAGGKKKYLRVFGKDWPTKDGTAIRDYIHVCDLSYGHILAMNYLLFKKSQILNLNLGTGKGTTVLELIKTFERVNNCTIKYEFEDRRPGDVSSLIADNNLSKKIFKWYPQKSIEEMCKDSWNCFIKNKYAI
ncbi:UDP-glucose 4-epimerase GalE [Prochlorococcus sp. HOT_208_60]|nr:UDP-glucose 4-epimerase GalE [Prochlorococcus sp. HOT_208_60]